MERLQDILPVLLAVAWLLPLGSFALIVLFGPKMGRHGVLAGYVATGAILGAFVLSMISFGLWLSEHPITASGGHDAAHSESDPEAHAATEPAFSGEQEVAKSQQSLKVNHPPTIAFVSQHDEDAGHAGDESAEHADDVEHVDDAEHHAAKPPPYYAAHWYSLGVFGALNVHIGYHIDILTICMFCMVTLIASCIHFYSIGYMAEELDDEVVDHECSLPDGSHLHRAGRFYRFFQYLSLFCFSMLGLVIAGNVAMVFVFWELVGICSYLLIGFYRERHSASTAANKAFIVNRVGDFGMIIGLMVLWGTLGTFTFGDVGDQEGLFSLVRPAEREYALTVPDGMVLASAAAADEIPAGGDPSAEQINDWREKHFGYGLLIVAGLGIFCGCVGKSAQFPLQVWLPDAMEGPTPVSALIHAATMVAAGVYLVGRFYPVFTPEVLLVIAYVGCITLFIAATIAVVATDIKRVLAFSTVSQLGYMMLGLGVGGWVAGLFHLFTHAFFKALLFLCSGSVIHACHTNEMPQMGGLRKKMPWTAYTMLVGCLAIAGAGIPFGFGLSGFHSKDAIIAQLVAFRNDNLTHAILFYTAAGGAALTAFYMFRLWYMTFAGKPRDEHVYDHAHESPRIMYVPLVILAVFAAGVAWTIPGTNLSLNGLLESAKPALPTIAEAGAYWTGLAVTPEHLSHVENVHVVATLVAFGTALAGFLLATVFYGLRWLDAAEVSDQFARIYRFLVHKWWFDELYQVVFVRPVLFVSRLVADLDKKGIDRIIDGSARWTVVVSKFDDLIDRYLVDGMVNRVADWIYAIGIALRGVQTGKIRQYVVLIVVGTVGLFVLASFFWSYSIAGG